MMLWIVEKKVIEHKVILFEKKKKSKEGFKWEMFKKRRWWDKPVGPTFSIVLVQEEIF